MLMEVCATYNKAGLSNERIVNMLINIAMTITVAEIGGEGARELVKSWVDMVPMLERDQGGHKTQ